MFEQVRDALKGAEKIVFVTVLIKQMDPILIDIKVEMIILTG